MNWNDLKIFCNSLDEVQLQQNVILWREDEAVTDIKAIELDKTITLSEGDESIKDIDAIQLDSEQYIEPEVIGEGCFPKWEAEDIVKNQPEDYPNGLAHFQKVYDKGHPVLTENF
ncbi:hypothetical protein [Pedobacter arcticus]|uniref:hypothetical protein n=1 Tax=Pedobacter arcticus TaxID=752140 RepID=UPI0002D56A74|nr:hypothetical protein [Pedobacter arcticus]